MASDGEEEQDFVTYGTPLEPLEEDAPVKKPVPIHEQTVKDEKGRYKRFHGAFTGGFSAGYFNTVGSKEGWTPSTFISSRQQKAAKVNARPEDFMDDEDFSEHGIAPSEITTTEDFASGPRDQIRDKARALSSLVAPIPGDNVLEDLISPARTSVGIELLRKMGWKEGQGVGPRAKRKPRTQKADGGPRVYGCALPPNGSEESEEEDDYVPENVTFAPKDVTPIDFTPKDDLHGLGYRGLDPQQALMGVSSTGHVDLFTLDSDRTSSLFGDNQMRHRRRAGVSGQAFGVGALEDDDEDIYHRDTLSNYDSVLGGEEPGDGLYGWTAPEQYNQKKKGSNTEASYLGKILEGFTLASKAPEAKSIFPPPDLPRDFRPMHYFRPVVDVANVSPIVAQALLVSGGQMSTESAEKGRHQLDASQRRSLLGESSLKGPTSVFDLLDSKDKERLEGIRRSAEERKTVAFAPEESRGAIVTASTAPAATTFSRNALSSRFQPPDSERLLSAWRSPTADTAQPFRPFEKNPEKQERYDLYISKLKQGRKDALESSLDPNMTEWERGRERDEFVRAAMLYKPSSSSLSCRFTRAKHQDDDNSVEVPRDQENDVDDKQAAVRMKMFGKLTRDTFEWHPDKLLCKRFNIPDPYPGSGLVGLPKVKRDKFSVFNFLTLSDSGLGDNGNQHAAPAAPLGTPKTAQPGKKSRWDIPAEAEPPKDPLGTFLSMARSEASAPQQGQSSETTSTPTLESKPEPVEGEEDNRPPMDLFKAIFASSSDEKSSSEEESEDEDNESGPEQTELVPHALLPPSSSAVPEVKPPVTYPDPAPPPPPPPLPQEPELEEEEFGPRLPPPSSSGPEHQSSISSWTQAEVHKKKSKEKHKAKKELRHKEKKHKKKSKNHKSKDKKKKKKKKRNKAVETTGSSGDSEEDSSSSTDNCSEGVSTTELLKRMQSFRGKELR
ncbi:G patch domain-containing protein 1 isoform X2 [Scleropages formosus]|uniref:G patch domain-containing protein 1 isoform X2 n=1 Tax=Scleropages formosus TaxID=113540 RepID=UPI000878BEAE|nr:G patch domain-containing protein 1 isoform X2 [Scleropages formosus]